MPTTAPGVVAVLLHSKPMQPPPPRIPYSPEGKEPQAIHSQVSCHRANHSNLVTVTTADAFLVAEYNVESDSFSWQRLLPAGQKLSIEEWVRERFPVRPKPASREVAKAKAASR